MSPRTAAALIAGLLAAGGGFLLLRRAPAAAEAPPPYRIEDGSVVFAPGAKMLARLEVLAVGAAASSSVEFRSVGQIVALSNASGSLTGEGVGWVELDATISRGLGLALDASSSDPAGTAYGVTTLAAEHAAGVEPGQSVAVSRYGLRKAGVPARVVKVLRRSGDGADVVFRFGGAQEWFPGTNCEISFPALRGRPVRVPTTAPVHEGVREYVWTETAPGRFAAREVSLVDATPTEAFVLGLEPGDRVVARGAILLKPLLKAALARGKG